MNLLFLGQEMKCGPVMPEIKKNRSFEIADVRDLPMNVEALVARFSFARLIAFAETSTSKWLETLYRGVHQRNGTVTASYIDDIGRGRQMK